jgi:hypothetical protein
MSKKKINIVNVYVGVMVGLIAMLISETIYLSISFGSYATAYSNAREVESNLTNVVDEIRWYSETWWYGIRGF